MKAQGESIRAIAEEVKLSKSFVHNVCKVKGFQESSLVASEENI